MAIHLQQRKMEIEEQPAKLSIGHKEPKTASESNTGLRMETGDFHRDLIPIQVSK